MFYGLSSFAKTCTTEDAQTSCMNFAFSGGKKSCQMGSICKADTVMQSQEIRGDMRKKYEETERKFSFT